MGKTLEELENDIWDEPTFRSGLVTTCHRLRKKPIDQFTVEDLRIMIGQNIGTEFLMPRALGVLESNPLAEGDFYPGDLLSSVTGLPEEYWARHPDHHLRALSAAEQALERLSHDLESNQDLVGRLNSFREIAVG